MKQINLGKPITSGVEPKCGHHIHSECGDRFRTIEPS